ncbi:hypothetical protein RsTz2092_01320 [Deferribacterales bacterium RsTz2092]|nr:hypothetical protein AGMMS49941_01950 [Deferribacterales bacterium]
MYAMTLDEKTNIALRSIELKKAGKKDEAMALSKTIPVSLSVAKAMKMAFGGDYVKNSGFNLSEVEAVYGKEWFDR